MKRRTTQEGLDLVRGYRASGLGQEKFAKRVRINVATLHYWLRKERQEGNEGSKPVRFVELAPAIDREGESQVRIETPSGIIVRIDLLPTADYLVELVLGLGRA